MTTDSKETRGDIPTRWVELIVALLIALGGAIVIVDSLRVGIEWADDGPRAGYFPFFIGCILMISAAWIAVRNFAAWRSLAGKAFVTQAELRPVLAMLLPTIAYVFLIYLIGIYVASAIYIGGFMVWQGKFRWMTTLAVSIGVPVALFLLFEIWFLVPLPKGPIEHFIGY
jgi:putative tricarboxylic transport membrane protein